MAHFFKATLLMANQQMEFLSLTKIHIMLEILRISNLQGMVRIKTLKVGIIMKANGRKTCSMAKEFKNIRMETNIEDSLCVAVNSDKASTNSQTGKFIKAYFIMGLAMVMAFLLSQTEMCMMGNGGLGKCTAEEFTNGKMGKNIKVNMLSE
jgi:hypothetical protein